MAPQQVWSRDSAGNLVYWTGTQWIQPQWNRDSAGNRVFWSPQYNQWFYPEVTATGSQPSARSSAHKQLFQITAAANEQSSNQYTDSTRGSKASGKRPAAEPVSLAAVATPYNAASSSTTRAAGDASNMAALIPGMASLNVGPSVAPAITSTLHSRKDASGITDYFLSSQAEGVHYSFQTGPASWITEPSALKSGLAAGKKFTDTGAPKAEVYEQLDERYKVRRQSRRFFKFGRVFMMLHPEPAGEYRSAVTPVTRDARYGEGFYISPRRFVVVTEGESSCTAIGIWTYNYQGVAKKGVQKSHHAIVFSGREAPPNVPTQQELPVRGEDPMKPQMIRVTMHDREADALHPMSRINFAKVYTIEHNVKIRDLGEVHPNSLGDLHSVFWTVQRANDAKHSRQFASRPQGGPSSRARIDSLTGSSSRALAKDGEGSESDQSEGEESEDGD